MCRHELGSAFARLVLSLDYDDSRVEPPHEDAAKHRALRAGASLVLHMCARANAYAEAIALDLLHLGQYTAEVRRLRGAIGVGHEQVLSACVAHAFADSAALPVVTEQLQQSEAVRAYLLDVVIKDEGCRVVLGAVIDDNHLPRKRPAQAGATACLQRC